MHDIVIESIHPILPRIWYPDSSIFSQFGRSKIIEDEYQKFKKDTIKMMKFTDNILSHLDESNTYLTLNNYPYNLLDGFHYILWLKYGNLVNKEYVNRFIESYFPKGKIIVYENLPHKRTVPGIRHVHIFSTVNHIDPNKKKCNIL